MSSSNRASAIDEHVGRRIKQRREMLGISQGRLGKQLGVSFSQVQKYEKGSNRIGAGRLHLISEALGVPIQYFFQGLGEGSRRQESVDCENEMGQLNEAFRGIPDPDTRSSVIALVRSLAPSENTPRVVRFLTG